MAFDELIGAGIGAGTGPEQVPSLLRILFANGFEKILLHCINEDRRDLFGQVVQAQVSVVLDQCQHIHVLSAMGRTL